MGDGLRERDMAIDGVPAFEILGQHGYPIRQGNPQLRDTIYKRFIARCRGTGARAAETASQAFCTCTQDDRDRIEGKCVRSRGMRDLTYREQASEEIDMVMDSIWGC